MVPAPSIELGTAYDASYVPVAECVTAMGMEVLEYGNEVTVAFTYTASASVNTPSVRTSTTTSTDCPGEATIGDAVTVAVRNAPARMTAPCSAGMKPTLATAQASSRRDPPEYANA